MHLNCCCTLFIMTVWPKHKNIIRPYFCSHSQCKHCYENHWWPTSQNKSISNNDKAFPTGGHMLPVNSFWKWLGISSPGMTDAWSQLLLQGFGAWPAVVEQECLDSLTRGLACQTAACPSVRTGGRGRKRGHWPLTHQVKKKRKKERKWGEREICTSVHGRVWKVCFSADRNLWTLLIKSFAR